MILKKQLKKLIYWKKNKILIYKLNFFFSRILVIYFKLPLSNFFNFKKKNINKGFQDFRNHKNHINVKEQLINRMLVFYKLNKKLNFKTSNSGVWKEWLDLNFKELIEHINHERVDKISDILNNMFRERIAVGAGSYDLWNRFNKIFGKHYINRVWSNYFEILKKKKFKLEKLKFPLIGNPCGLEYNNSIISTETLRHAYLAQKISNYLHKEVSYVVDIGPGLGGVMYQLLNIKKKTKIFLIDLPEMIFFSSAFISTAFPDKKLFFYGEDEKQRENSDILFIPNTQKNFLNKYDIDVYLNSCSFSEMDQFEVRDYIEVINRNSKGYLIHDNHEQRFEYTGKNNVSTNIIGSKIGQFLNGFELLEKVKRKHKLPEEQNIEHYEYVYRKL